MNLVQSCGNGSGKPDRAGGDWDGMRPGYQGYDRTSMEPWTDVVILGVNLGHEKWGPDASRGANTGVPSWLRRCASWQDGGASHYGGVETLKEPLDTEEAVCIRLCMGSKTHRLAGIGNFPYPRSDPSRRNEMLLEVC